MNVVWIVIDCLRRDRLGCYGYGRNTSPNLDRLARECLRFDQMISPHIPTQPAHTTFFSGRDVFAHQIVAQGGPRELDPDIPLLPALLREAGYYTAAVDNIGRWIEPAFERYEMYPRWNHDGALPWRNGEEVTARGLEILREASPRQPFFLFLHYWDPHTPYLPPPPFDRMFYTGDEKHPDHRSMDAVWQSPWFASYFSEWMPGVRDIEYVKAQYDASIAYTDACVAHVFNRLEELGLWEDAVLLLQADHGEELDDHGMWFDHHGLYETNVRVPLLLRLPGGRGGGRVIEPMLSVTDLAPTLLEILGRPELAGEMTGVSRTRLLNGSGAGQESVYLTECTWMRKRGWRTPEWKLIEALEPDIYGRPAVELYHLPTDPGEQADRAGSLPETVALLRQDRDAHVARRMGETGLPDPLVEQADALRTWQPRFMEGRRGMVEG